MGKIIVRAVAWDLDGTLAESEVLAMPAAVGAASNYVQQQKSDTIITPDERAAFVQQLMGKTITEIGEAVGCAYDVEMPHDLQERVTRDTIILLAAQCEPVASAIEVVRVVIDAGIDTWIATSSAPERVLPTLEATGLGILFPQQEWGWFSAMVTKPDPEVYLRSIQIRGYTPAAVLAVEDSPTGVAAAKAAGMGYIVGFTGGSHIPDHRKDPHAQLLLAAGADVVVSTLGALLPVVADLTLNPTLPRGTSQIQGQTPKPR